MTINLAWRDGNELFLVADSALSYPFGGSPRQTLSAVGENQRSGSDRVEESGAKLVPLSSTVVATYAGDTQAAVSALILLRRSLQSGLPVRECLVAVTHRFASSLRFQLIVASIAEGRCDLWVVDPGASATVIREIYQDREPVVLGSLPRDAVAFIREGLSSFYKLEPLARAPNRMLAAAIMALQALGQRVALTAHGVGGTFFGVTLGPAGIAYQDDVVYALFRRSQLQHPSDASAPLFVFAGVRDGFLVTCSSVTAGYKVFVTDAHEATNEDVDRIMRQMISDFRGCVPMVASHYGFIDRETGSLVQVYCPTRRPERYVQIESGGMTITPALAQHLMSLPEPKDGILPSVVPHLFLAES